MGVPLSATTRKREQSIGVSVSETKSETSTPKVTTTAKERKNWPMMPLMKMTGAKIETSDSVAAMTAKTTSLLPLMAAETGVGIEFLAVAEDVLQHDDGVVDDDHADQQQQRQQVSE